MGDVVVDVCLSVDLLPPREACFVELVEVSELDDWVDCLVLLWDDLDLVIPMKKVPIINKKSKLIAIPKNHFILLIFFLRRSNNSFCSLSSCCSNWNRSVANRFLSASLSFSNKYSFQSASASAKSIWILPLSSSVSALAQSFFKSNILSLYCCSIRNSNSLWCRDSSSHCLWRSNSFLSFNVSCCSRARRFCSSSAACCFWLENCCSHLCCSNKLFCLFSSWFNSSSRRAFSQSFRLFIFPPNLHYNHVP